VLELVRKRNLPQGERQEPIQEAGQTHLLPVEIPALPDPWHWPQPDWAGRQQRAMSAELPVDRSQLKRDLEPMMGPEQEPRLESAN